MSDPDHPFGDAADRGVPQFAARSDIDANALAGSLCALPRSGMTYITAAPQGPRCRVALSLLTLGHTAMRGPSRRSVRSREVERSRDALAIPAPEMGHTHPCYAGWRSLICSREI